MEDIGNNIIAKAKVTYVLTGYGDLLLTDKALAWNKSASSFLAFGATNALTASHRVIMLEDVSAVNTYTYLPGGGLTITEKNGKIHKFSFKKSKDFKVFYNYIKEHIG